MIASYAVQLSSPLVTRCGHVTRRPRVCLEHLRGGTMCAPCATRHGDDHRGSCSICNRDDAVMLYREQREVDDIHLDARSVCGPCSYAPDDAWQRARILHEVSLILEVEHGQLTVVGAA